jgi:hypothetical protein
VFSALSDGAVGRGSARAGASRLASPRRMNQTETLRFRLAAAIVTADKQIGPGPSFSKRSRGARLVSATPKLATSQIAAVHLWVQAFWSKRPGSPGSGGVYRPDRSFTPVRIHRLQVRNTISKSWGDVKWFGRRSLWAARNHGTVQEPIRHKRPPPPLSLRSGGPSIYSVWLLNCAVVTGGSSHNFS